MLTIEFAFLIRFNCFSIVKMIASPAIVIEKIEKEEAQEVTESWNGNGHLPYDSVKNANNENNRFQQRQGSTRRLIKVDYSVIQNTDDDDDDDEEEEEKYIEEPKTHTTNSDELAKVTQQNAMCRTGTVSSGNTNSSSGIFTQSDEKNLERRLLSLPIQSMKSASPSCTIF